MDGLTEEIRAYVPKLIQGIDEMAGCFHGNDIKKATTILDNVITGLDWTSRAFVSLSNDYSEDINDLNTSLDKINKALENEDYILVADLFEYEITGKLTTLQETLPL